MRECCWMFLPIHFLCIWPITNITAYPLFYNDKLKHFTYLKNLINIQNTIITFSLQYWCSINYRDRFVTQYISYFNVWVDNEGDGFWKCSLNINVLCYKLIPITKIQLFHSSKFSIQNWELDDKETRHKMNGCIRDLIMEKKLSIPWTAEELILEKSSLTCHLHKKSRNYD